MAPFVRKTAKAYSSPSGHAKKRPARVDSAPAPQAKRARLEPKPKTAKARLALATKGRPSPLVKAKGKGKDKGPLFLNGPAARPSKPVKSGKPPRSITDPEEAPAKLPSAFKVIAGSYEKLLYGLQGTITAASAATDEPSGSGSSYAINLKPIFMFPAHVSCIKAVAASPGGGKWLATGSADEIIKVWDLRRRKEIGGLMHHEGSITQLHFPSRAHMLSASEDGTLCLFHARDWSVLRALRGHTGRVNAVTVHPSGKLALSVGRDRTLRMWDLMRGRGSASTKLGKEGEVVRWSTTGSRFVVASGSTLDIYSTNMALLHTLKHPSRIHDVHFVRPAGATNSDTPTDDVLLVSAEDRKVAIYALPPLPPAASAQGHAAATEPETEPAPAPAPIVFAELIGHTNRIKALSLLTVALPPSPLHTRTATTLASTVSSDGFVFVYDLAALPAVPVLPLPTGGTAEVVQISPVAEYDTSGSRLTCVALAEDVDGVPAGEAGAVGEKRKRDESEDKDKDEDREESGSDEGSEAGQGLAEEEEEWQTESEGEEEES